MNAPNQARSDLNFATHALERIPVSVTWPSTVPTPKNERQSSSAYQPTVCEWIVSASASEAPRA
jgi:hypothetical protein